MKDVLFVVNLHQSIDLVVRFNTTNDIVNAEWPTQNVFRKGENKDYIG
jgi:hypothetical protein